MANPGTDTSVQRCATHAGAQSPPVLTVNTSDPTRLLALSTRSGCSFVSNSPTPTDVNEASKGKSSSPYSQRDEQDASVLLSLAEERDSRTRSHSLDKDTKVSELPPAVPGATARTQAVIFPTPGCSISPQSRVVNVSAGLSPVQEAVCAGSGPDFSPTRDSTSTACDGHRSNAILWRAIHAAAQCAPCPTSRPACRDSKRRSHFSVRSDARGSSWRRGAVPRHGRCAESARASGDADAADEHEWQHGELLWRAGRGRRQRQL